MLEKLSRLKEEVLETLNNVGNLEELNDLKVKILGKKGEFTTIMKGMADIAAEKRAEFGKVTNELKTVLQDKFDEKLNTLKEKAKQERLKNETIDITLPGRKADEGSLHPLTKTVAEIKEIVSDMGFDIVDGPEIEYTKYNFDALNIPETHPSRELSDTFYIQNDVLLRTQTSGMQIRYMLDRKPPFRMVSIGKVYRPDYDVSHTPMFHQMEGLMIGEDVSFSNFKAILENIVKKIFGKERNVRFRPHFFPFTEPSAEMDVECGVCRGAGCRVCKGTGWLEILGSGMVNPKVLQGVGIDPQKYQGFAFGLGLERITMLKYGIDDLRAFFENDVRFLDQF
ncbi:phenylalanine--tRNA ligase subunit alpha [Pseudoleptotrichia goodfellowii]|uniref:Phenylalanine--tRNA ligase alpha subunit n=2 Tax=Pseudoleptotrichia goodfellowii TaxID=157692 RepID=D0GN55_9FUSO|nr:phenylalanine--tRNA ligase subunit alpha [Pseudoleptotrichia goodfellowii]EEY34463.1 phenylalanine--tRNA ligase, alpha subunit [Pseudoleptotrichia goodfellowii F0264]MBF4805150.1 phenylalanine--tRNA ligase subunit alpha [Pseudoleptotrichia goodfellowii]BBM35164.1 phenylalanyl-tRNA synthetase subunit alpha [Pseudoleptotrichia goodfellowii]